MSKNGYPIYPKGQDVVDALRDWSKDELKNGPSRGYDLGKFLFTVSAGTVGIIVGFAKLLGTTNKEWNLILSILLFLVSMFIALLMVIPRIWDISGDTDLVVEYSALIKRYRSRLWLWGLCWLLGFLIVADTFLFDTPFLNKLINCFHDRTI